MHPQIFPRDRCFQGFRIIYSHMTNHLPYATLEIQMTDVACLKCYDIFDAKCLGAMPLSFDCSCSA